MRYSKLESSGTYQDQTTIFADQRAAALAVATLAAVDICTICHCCGMIVEGGDEEPVVKKMPASGSGSLLALVIANRRANTSPPRLPIPQASSR